MIRRTSLALAISCSLWANLVCAAALAQSILPPGPPVTGPPVIGPPPEPPTPTIPPPTFTPPTVPPTGSNPPPPINTPGFTPPTFTTPVLPTDVSRGYSPFMPTMLLPAALEPRPGSFQFVTGGCQPSGGGDSGYYTVPTRGALYSVEDKGKIKLARGRMLVAADESKVTVTAGPATINVPPRAAVIVEAQGSGMARIYGLAAGEGTDDLAAVHLAHDQKPWSVPPGQDLMVSAGSPINDKEINADGLSHRPISGSSTNDRVRASEYSLTEMAGKNLLLPCRIIALPNSKSARLLQDTDVSLPVNRPMQVFRRVYDQVLAQGALQPDFYPTSHAGTQAKFGESPSPGAQAHKVQHQHLVHDKDTVIVASKHATCKRIDGKVTLLELGSLLVWSDRAQRIICQSHQIDIAPQTCAILNYNGSTLKVINLADSHKGAITIKSGRQSLDVPMASEVILSKDSPSLGDVFDVHTIGHRQLETQHVDGFGWVTRSEIAIIDALRAHPLMHALRHDPSATKRHAVDRITRTAAVVNMLTARKGAYTRGEPGDASGTVARLADCQGCNN